MPNPIQKPIQSAIGGVKFQAQNIKQALVNTSTYAPVTASQQLTHEQSHLTSAKKDLYDTTAAQMRNYTYQQWGNVLANLPFDYRQTAEQIIKPVGKEAIPIYAAFHPGQTAAFFKYLNSATAMSPLLMPVGLVSYYYLWKKASALEYKYNLSKLKASPEYYLQQLPAYYTAHHIRKYAFKGLGLIAQPVGHALGLTQNIDTPSQFLGINTILPTFKPAYRFRQNYSDWWERLARKGTIGIRPKIGFTNKNGKFMGYKGFWGVKLGSGSQESAFRIAARRIARKKREKGGLNPISIIFGDLVVGFLGGALLAWMERTPVGMLMSGFAQGVGGPMAKGLFSFSTLSGAYLGHNTLGKLPILKTPVKLPFVGIQTNLGAIAGGMGGWHYQTLVNIANNQSITGLHYLRITQGYGKTLAETTRYKAVPRSWGDFNDPANIFRLEKEGYVAKIPGTSPLNDPSNIQVRVLNARWLPQASEEFATFSREGFLRNLPYNAITRPAKFMFQHPWLRLPLTGLAISQLLQLNAWQTALACGVDMALQASKAMPSLQTIKNFTISGGIAGAEIAAVTGGNVFLGTAIGGGIGAVSGIAKLVGGLSQPIRWIGGAPFIKGSTPFYTPIGNEELLWCLENPFTVLSQRFAAYPGTGFFGKLNSNISQFLSDRFNWLDQKQGSLFNKFIRPGLKSFQYAKGALSGFTLGTSISFLLSLAGIQTNPWIMGSAGALGGAASQAVWNNLRFERLNGLRFKFEWGGQLDYLNNPGFRTLAERWAGLGGTYGRFSQFVGENVLRPIGGFFSGMSIMSFVFDAFHGVFPQGLGWAGLGLNVVGATSAILLGSTAGIISVVVGAVAEIISQIFFKRSLFQLIWTKLTYAFPKVGNFLKNAAGAALGILMGLLQAMTARTTDELAQGALLVATSIAGLATGTAIVFVIGSSFFTPLEKSIYLSGKFTNINKEFIGQPDADGKITQLKYNMEFHYDQELGKNLEPINDGEPPGAIYNATFTDSYDNLTWSDISNITQTTTPSSDFWDLTPQNHSEKTLLRSNSCYNNILPNSTISNILTVNLKRPLNEIIKDNGTLCNIFLAQGVFPSTSQKLFNQTKVCINSKGEKANPPAAQFADDLIKATRYACSQTTRIKNDCLDENDVNCQIKRDVYTQGCINLSGEDPLFLSYFLNKMEEKGYSRDNININIAAEEIIQSTANNTCLQCVDFALAHQIGIGTQLDVPGGACAKDYANQQSTHHTWHDASEVNLLQEGDVVIFAQIPGGNNCGHMAVVTQVMTVDGQISVAEAHGGDPDTCTGTLSANTNIFVTDPAYNFLGFYSPL